MDFEKQLHDNIMRELRDLKVEVRQINNKITDLNVKVVSNKIRLGFIVSAISVIITFLTNKLQKFF